MDSMFSTEVSHHISFNARGNKHQQNSSENTGQQNTNDYNKQSWTRVVEIRVLIPGFEQKTQLSIGRNTKSENAFCNNQY